MKFSAFKRIQKILYNYWIVGYNTDGNFKITFKDFIEGFSLDISTGGGTPIFFDGLNLPDVNNLGDPLAKGDWALLEPGKEYINIGGGSNVITPLGRWSIGVFNGSSWSLKDMGELPMQDISNLATKEEVAEKVGFVDIVGKNMFNKATLTEGFYMSTGGNPFPSETMGYSTPIKVITGQRYRARSATTLQGMRYLTAYDVNGQVIPGSGLNAYTSDWTPTNPDIDHVIITIPLAAKEDFQFEAGDVPTEYVPYEISKRIDPSAILLWESVDTSVSKVGVNQVDFTRRTVNLFNKNVFIANRFVTASNGNLGTPSGQYSYNASDYIDVEVLSEITVNFTHQCAFYDENKVFISGVSLSRSFNVTTIPVPAGAFFYRQGVEPTFMDEFMLVAGDTMPSEYVAFGYEIDPTKLSVPKPAVPDITPTINLLDSITGQAAKKGNAELSDGGILTLTDFPFHIKKNISISARAEFSSFSGNISVGKGKGKYRGMFIEVNDTNLICRFQNSASTLQTVGAVPHGLTINTFLNSSIFMDESSVLHVSIGTLGGLFSTTFEPTRTGNRGLKYEWNYEPFIDTTGQELTDVYLTASSLDFQKPIHVFYDSYGGIALNRPFGQLRKMGFFNYSVDALAGISSSLAVVELQKYLNYCTPKYLVWLLGMNDSSLTAYTNAVNQVISLCTQKGIELILGTIPSVPTRNNETKNDFVRSSGYRYIDVAKAVGANSNGEWYNGTLDVDGVHPNTRGAELIAMQNLVDFPEFMQYGLTEFTTTIEDTVGDN